MNLLFWKHKKIDGVVIKADDHKRLPMEKRKQFQLHSEHEGQHTHDITYIDEVDEWALNPVLSTGIWYGLDNPSLVFDNDDDASPSAPAFEGMGGGDFGGGGSGGDFPVGPGPSFEEMGSGLIDDSPSYDPPTYVSPSQDYSTNDNADSSSDSYSSSDDN